MSSVSCSCKTPAERIAQGSQWRVNLCSLAQAHSRQGAFKINPRVVASVLHPGQGGTVFAPTKGQKNSASSCPSHHIQRQNGVPDSGHKVPRSSYPNGYIWQSLVKYIFLVQRTSPGLFWTFFFLNLPHLVSSSRITLRTWHMPDKHSTCISLCALSIIRLPSLYYVPYNWSCSLYLPTDCQDAKHLKTYLQSHLSDSLLLIWFMSPVGLSVLNQHFACTCSPTRVPRSRN